MNPELFIIELLSSKEKLVAYDKETRQKNLLAIVGYLIGTSLLFIGFASLVYRIFGWRLRSITGSYIFEGIYYFSLTIGIVSSVILLVLLIKNILAGLLLAQSFNRWLEKNVKKMLKVSKVYQEKDFYYLASETKTPKIRLTKAACTELTTTLDDFTIIIGRKSQFPGIGSNQLFLLKGEPPLMPQTFSKVNVFNQRVILLLAGLFLLSMAGVTYYETSRYYQNFYGSYSEDATTYSSSSEVRLDASGLLSQQGSPPDYPISQTNQLELVSDSNELYMTTDSGNTWSFIPLKPEWLRFGSYLLTSGEIPFGYWMDKTYEISPDFSWFIYSQNEQELAFLSSTDNGQTWQQSLVTDTMRGARYRKATFFGNGSGVLVYSTISPEVSSEGLMIYHTNDFGQTWNQSNSTTISQPVQNVSFVNPTLGFVSTREHVYYTNNAGSSFKESVITIPEGYQTGGLDIFQSPNEVIQVSTNLLETRFYLLNMGEIDYGKMFAFRYQSTDNGQTWQLVEQLSQVEQTD